MGKNGVDELSRERDSLEEERAKEKARRMAEYEARRVAEEKERQKELEKERRQKQIEIDEFEQLVAEIKPLSFFNSSQVSRYITRNNLGNKYKNISGVVTMQANGEDWKYKGGFPTHIYAKLCSELGLENQGSRARVKDFTSYNDMGMEYHRIGILV